MISGFAMSARENSKAGRLMSDVSLAVDIHCIVLLWDVLQDRINGFIHERWLVPGWLSRTGGAPAKKRRVARRSQCHRHGGIEYDWIHS
jgi:hypothetical protein